MLAQRSTQQRSDTTLTPVNPSYPVNLLVQSRPCLVVGGGNVAIRKVQGLLLAGAAVTVVAPEIRDELRELNIRTFERPYQSEEAANYRLVITCTDNASVNAQVFRDAESAGVWVNSADDPVNCAFTLPAVAWQGDLSVAISTAGKSPALAMWLRRRFEQEFDHSYRELLDLLVDVRAEARSHFGTSEVAGWQEAMDSGLLELIVEGRANHARQQLRTHLNLPPVEILSVTETRS